jgi:hypothetical protein
MTTGLTYTTYKSQIATMAVVEESDPNFLTILPMMIDYAELRMYRDLDFLFTSTTNSTQTCVVGNRQITVPVGTFVVTDQINVISPAGTVNPDAGTRNPLLPTTKEFLDAVYGTPTAPGLPKYYCAFNDNVFLIGPFPDQAYRVEITGTFRPASLSVSTPTTFISQYLPDLFVMASMVYISAYQRNFGRANDDPQMAITYESQYQGLLKGAAVEEARKKYEASAWSSQSPSPVATPTR